MNHPDYRSALQRRIDALNAEAEALRQTLESYQTAQAITIQAEGAHHGALLLRGHADTVSAYAHGDTAENPSLSTYPLSITIDPVSFGEVTPPVTDALPGELASIGVEISTPNRPGPTFTMRADLHPDEAAALADHMRQIAYLMELAADRALAEVMAEFPAESGPAAAAADSMSMEG